MLYLLFKITKDKDAHDVFVVLTIVCAFVTGVVLTTPPPAFHRFSIAFPFLALLISVAITDLYMVLKAKHVKGAFLLLLFCLVAVIIGNAIHFKKILKTDGPDDPDFPQIQQDLNKEDAHMVYVASPHKYGLGIVLFIRSDKTINSVNHPLDELLEKIPHNRTSYLVIVYPSEESTQRVKKLFPNTKIINQYNTHMLLKVID